MQSPRRLDSVNVTSPYDDDFTLSKLKMSLSERQRDEARLGEVHQSEKREIETTTSKLEMALHSASGVLGQKRRMLDEANRDLAHMAVLRSKQLHDRSQRQIHLEESIHQLRVELEVSQKNLSEMENTVVGARNELAEKQRSVEGRYEAGANLQNKMAEYIRQVDMLKAHHQTTTTNHTKEQSQLENQVLEMEREAANIVEHNRRMVSAIAARQEDHQEQSEILRKQHKDYQDGIEHYQQLLSAARERMQEMTRAEDEGSHHYRKADEEAARDAVAERQVFLQKLNSERAELVRTMRNDTEKQCSAARVKIDQSVGQLPTLRDDIQRGFQRESELHQVIRNLSEEVVGTESAAQRHQVGMEHAAHWKDQVSQAQDDIQLKMKVLEERQQFMNVLRDTTAPLPSVETSISEMHAKADSYNTARADAEAEFSIWKIQNQEKLENKQQKMAQLKEEITEMHAKLREAHDEQEERRIGLESEMATMRTEQNAVEDKLRDMSDRNKLLDSSLEHLTRQRRILTDELAQRRDAARMAATSLLAQLQ